MRKTPNYRQKEWNKIYQSTEWSRYYNYKLTPKEHTEILENQEDKCAICGCSDKKLVVDHCHTTGKVRGLLCDMCNSGLGFFKDNPESLYNAIQYLQKVDTNVTKSPGI